jgi:two-component system response regulator PilR (NtrC family)
MGVRLLYADDEAALREMVQNHLSLEGYDVETVADGEGAIEMLNGKKFDIVLLDVHMPNVDGLGVLKHMHARGIRSKLIMLTGDGDPQIANECAKYGASDYLTKPYNYHELIDAIDRVMADGKD